MNTNQAVASLSHLHQQIASGFTDTWAVLTANDANVRCRDLDGIEVGRFQRIDYLTRSDLRHPVVCGKDEAGRLFLACRFYIQHVSPALPANRGFEDVDVVVFHQKFPSHPLDERSHWVAAGVPAQFLGLRPVFERGDVELIRDINMVLRRQKEYLTLTNLNGQTYRISLDEAR